MDMSQQQHTSNSPSHVASYIDAREHSPPQTPLSPTSPTQTFHNASQMDGYTHHPAFPAPNPNITSPAKPGKRKRLAKACDACHRSKRRCDGTSPCSNCDFAGKPCTYTDPSGRAVAPPRTRSVDLRPGQLDGWPYPLRASNAVELERSLRPTTPVPTILDPSPSPLDAAVTRELVNLFFAHCHPVTLIIHRSSFLNDLSRSQVPTYLLLAVFVLAAPYSLQSSIRTGTSPSWHAGEQFASQAVNMILGTERTSNSSNTFDSLRIRPCLELAQALCLLQAHDGVMRRPGEPNRFMLLAHKVLQAIGVMSMDQTPLVSSLEDHIRNESMRRTFWFIHYVGLLTCAFTGRAPPAISEELNHLRMPVEEALFDLPRVDNRPGIQSSYDYFQLPVENKACRSEFANLIRVCRIYATIVSATSQKVRLLQAWDIDHVSNAQIPSVTPVEVGLRRWLELLPDYLRLTQENLATQLSQLDGGAGTGAWAFIYMHALAECTVLALHEFSNVGMSLEGPRALVPREQKALENLTMILGALGQRGRANITVGALLVAIGNHYSPQDPQVATWFDEYFRMWGVSYEELMNKQFRSSWGNVTSMLPGSPQHFADDTYRGQFGPDDMDFRPQDRNARRPSNSDSSSTGRSAASRKVVDRSAPHMPTNRYYDLRDEPQLLQDFSSSSGSLGGMRDGVLTSARLVGDEMGTEGPGTFMNERSTRNHLPTLITNGLTGRGGMGLNHDQESGQATMDSTSSIGSSGVFQVQPQGRYRSRISPHSNPPYTRQRVDDSEFGVDDLGWLADGTKMQ